MLRIAVAGSDTLIGEALLEFLEERAPDDCRLTLLDREEGEGSSGLFRGRRPGRALLETFDFREADVVVVLDGSGVPVDAVLAAGCHLIDLGTGDARGQLAVADINGDVIAGTDQPLWLSSPDAAVVLLGTVLQTLQPLLTPVRLDAFVAEAVSHRGRGGIESLAGEAARLLNGQPVKRGAFGRQAAFNLLPVSSSMLPRADDLRELLDDWGLTVNLSAATIPVFYGDSISVRLECAEPLDIEAVAQALENESAIHYLAEDEGLSPVESAGDDRIHVGGLQWDAAEPQALNFWIVADNVRKGAALNIIQLTEILIKMSQ